MNKSYATITFFLLLFFLLPGVLLKAQKDNKPNRYYYDFDKKQLYRDAQHTDSVGRPLLVREGKEFQIEITGFNPLDYSIIIEDTAFDMFSSNIDDFNKLLNLSAIQGGNTSAVYPKSNKDGNDTPYTTKVLNVCPNVSSIKKSSDSMFAAVYRYNKFIKSLNLINEVYLRTTKLQTFSPSVIRNMINDLIVKGINHVLPESLQYNSNVLPDTSWFVKTEEALSDSIFQFKIVFDSLEKLIKRAPDACFAEEIESILKVKMFLQEFESQHKYQTSPAFRKIMITYSNLTDWAFRVPLIVTRSYTVSKDMRRIEIYKQEKGSDNKKLYDIINVKMTRGFKIDVSGGLFVSGLYDAKFTLYSKDSIFTSQYIKYDSVPTLADSLVNDKFTAIYPQNNTKVSYGGMMFLNAHTQNACFVNYGFYLGIGALFSDQTRWSGSFGGSLILGRNQRFTFHAGVVMAQVNRLSQPYETSVFYRKTFDEIPISSIWKASWLVGFSWQIGK